MNVKAEITKEERKVANFVQDKIVKQREFEQQSSSQSEHDDPDEEIENKMKENINIAEKNIFGLSAQPSRQQVYEQKMAIFEQKLERDDVMNNSLKSSSKFSVPDSENFGEKKFIVSTHNNKISDANQRGPRHKNDESIISSEKVYKGTTKGGMSIRSIQNNQNRKYQTSYSVSSTSAVFKPSKNESLQRNENFHETSKLNTSQQQSINMYSKEYTGTEAGKRRNSPYSVHNPFPFAGGINEGSDGSNKNNSFLNNIKNNLHNFGGEGASYGISSQMPPYFGTSGNDQNSSNEMNPMMNSFMMQMMILQQNAALIAQQTELIKSIGSRTNRNSSVERDMSASRSRSRPRRIENTHINIKGDKSYDNRSQIERSNFSELNDEIDRNYPDNNFDRYNIRAESASVERKQRFNDINKTTKGYKASETANKLQGNKSSRPKEKAQEAAVGIVLMDAKCRVNSNLKVLEGDQVIIERFIAELNLYQCRHNNQVGLYPKEAIKIIAKKGQTMNQKNKKSLERLLENIEKDKKEPKKSKLIGNKSGSFNPMRKSYNEENDDISSIDKMMRESPYDSSKSKHDDSQTDILLYNSMKREENDFKLNIPGFKRQSKEGDFAKASHSVIESFNYDEDDLSDEQDPKPPSNKTKNQQYDIYYEPKNTNNDKSDRSKDKQERATNYMNTKQIHNDEIEKTRNNERNKNYPNSYYKEELKIPKATTSRKSNSKFLNTNTFVEKNNNPFKNEKQLQEMRDQKYQMNSSTKINFDGIPINPNESMSSNQSSLNKSLKMQNRRQKRQLREALKNERSKHI